MSDELGDRDGGRTDIFAPCSNWDVELTTEKPFTISSGAKIGIAVNDWVDVIEGTIPLDPMWGCSYQVADTNSDDVVQIRFYDEGLDLYVLMPLSSSLIENCYRRSKEV